MALLFCQNTTFRRIFRRKTLTVPRLAISSIKVIKRSRLRPCNKLKMAENDPKVKLMALRQIVIVKAAGARRQIHLIGKHFYARPDGVGFHDILS